MHAQVKWKASFVVVYGFHLLTCGPNSQLYGVAALASSLQLLLQQQPSVSCQICGHTIEGLVCGLVSAGNTQARLCQVHTKLNALRTRSCKRQ